MESTIGYGKLYEKLAEYLDQGVVGSPKSPALMEILKILFPGEEAEVAARVPMQDTSLPELRRLFPERADSIEEMVERMVKRGTVFVSGRQRALHAGIVEEPIDASEGFHRRIGIALHVAFFAAVGNAGFDARAGASQCAGALGQPRGVDIDHGEQRALPREDFAGGEADGACGTCDDDGFSGVAAHFLLPAG